MKDNLVVFENKAHTNEAEKLLEQYDDIFLMEEGLEKDLALMKLDADILRYRANKNPKLYTPNKASKLKLA